MLDLSKRWFRRITHLCFFSPDLACSLCANKPHRRQRESVMWSEFSRELAEWLCRACCIKFFSFVKGSRNNRWLSFSSCRSWSTLCGLCLTWPMLGTSRYRWSLTPALSPIWYLCSVIRRSKFRYQKAPPVYALEYVYLTIFIKNDSSLCPDRCPQGCWEHSDWHRWTDPGGAQLWCS